MRTQTMKALLVLLLATLSFSSNADDAVLDTSENRIAIASRIVKDGSFIKMVMDAEIQKLPIDQQEKMRQAYAQPGMLEVLQRALYTSFVENFTASELAILEPLYGSRTGIEALKKFGKFNSDLAKNAILESSRRKK